MQIYIYIYTQHHNDTINKQTSEDFFTKYITLTLFVTFERVIQGLRVRGNRRPNRNCNILTSLLWPSALCLSCSPDVSIRRTRKTQLLGDGFFYCILSATSLDPNSIGGPEPLRPGVAFPTTLAYDSVRSLPGTLTSVLTKLYNSSTPTQSPTRSLEWHD